MPVDQEEENTESQQERSRKRRKRKAKSDQRDDPMDAWFWSNASTSSLESHFQQMLCTIWQRTYGLTALCPMPFIPTQQRCSSTGSLQQPYLRDSFRITEENLNSVKSEVGQMDPEEWRSLTNYTDLASLLRYDVKNNQDLELGTNAWLKFWNILHEYPELTKSDGTATFSSLHLCEAPGAFVSALNHFLSCKLPEIHKSWKWLASSLSPYDTVVNKEAIVEDTLIRCTKHNWHFGADDSGDILRRANRSALVEAAKTALGDVWLVTADGGLDCSEHPADQEETLAALKLAEAVTALRILTKGGNFVLKIFTTFLWKTCVLLRILCGCFLKVNLYKPPTSKSGNSETYVVCLDFCGDCNSVDSINYLLDLEASDLPSEYMHSIVGDEFVQELDTVSQLFAQFQSEAIRTNLAVYSTSGNRRQRTCFHRAKQQFSQQFLLRAPVPPLSKENKLLTVEDASVEDTV
ncbi:cap-specific mRNA (nucleoside-2'-O-)-methyltransferase 2-like [Paramacrobiotus metropolitanus]|uniref:cap-specific mRNA (nucleoside-2'-O-)-methyltransferase 2-like n=1 Tax=Paramacrobiotus metropolitanus TaxID=2943436 RepID=UPI00244589ED|nr:cap-specific mRNA (nucleoside-2'-O-)-methyltransferase 2-like [Paramacrobiotus metropolitanus]XP_055341065.1 cap-specific mRNA (nucleoside-2'-O-)-methyltransferase 2-like [Paramacrobiotus metropolitanus]